MQNRGSAALRWPSRPPSPRLGLQVVGVYEKDGLSGADGATSGPGSDRLLKDATACKVNMVAARSVDRFGGSVQDLVGLPPAWLRRLRRLASRSTGAVAVAIWQLYLHVFADDLERLGVG
jgi:hypothetical protein